MSDTCRFDLATEFVRHGPVLTHNDHGAVVLVGCACDKPLPLARDTSGPDWTNFALHMAEVAMPALARAWDEGYRLDWTGGVKFANPHIEVAVLPPDGDGA